jgi:long-chain-fatty-acid--[acyl-carrier-protein] ligase
MVSLGAIEEALQPEVPVLDGAPTIAITFKGTEGETRPIIIAFTTGKLTQERANELLDQAGFPNLVKVSAVKRLEQIPVLGTGKTDYQSLNKL